MTGASASPGETRLTSLQALRCFAALLVVMDHTIEALVRRGLPIGDLMAFSQAVGGLGVAVFFMISGFVMVLTGRGQFGRPGAVRVFVERRLIRIVPLYWIMTLVAFVVARKWTPFDWEMLARSTLFIPMARPTGDVQPTLGVGWSLNYEMLFYAIFAAGLLLPMRRGLAAILGTVVALCAIGIGLSPWIQVPYGSGFFLSYYVHPFMQYFAYGLAIGWAYVEWPAVRSRLAPAVATALQAAICAGGVWLLLLRDDQGADTNAIYIPVVVLTGLISAMAAAASGGLVTRALMASGDASYSLYLTHLFLVGPISYAWTRFVPFELWMLAVPGSMVVCTLFSLLVYRLVEVPILQSLRSRLPRRIAIVPKES